jgi:3-phenylpropionate/cinnamic acid dioxygenase small subunit
VNDAARDRQDHEGLMMKGDDTGQDVGVRLQGSDLLLPLSTEDRFAIQELLALHGHVMDEGLFDRLDQLFAPDVRYDLEDFGAGVLRGVDAIRDAALALGDGNPVAHHVTNVLISTDADGTVRVRSKGIGIQADGSAGSVVYDDIVVRLEGGWRIASRKVLGRRAPLGGAGGANVI